MWPGQQTSMFYARRGDDRKPRRTLLPYEQMLEIVMDLLGNRLRIRIFGPGPTLRGQVVDVIGELRSGWDWDVMAEAGFEDVVALHMAGHESFSLFLDPLDFSAAWIRNDHLLVHTGGVTVCFGPV